MNETMRKSVDVEQRGWADIKRLLGDLSNGTLEGKFDDDDAQREGYDLFARTWQYSNGKPAKLELKVEEENPNRNFFIEMWSNKAFGRQKPGWAVTLKADWLLYYFLTDKSLYVIPAAGLWRWLFGGDGEAGSIVNYRQIRQRKSKQRNVTCGHLVPIGHVYRHVKFAEYRLVDGGWRLISDFDCDFYEKYQVMAEWNNDWEQPERQSN